MRLYFIIALTITSFPLAYPTSLSNTDLALQDKIIIQSSSAADSTITDTTQSQNTSDVSREVNDSLGINVPEGISAQDIIDDYVEVIGGEEKLYSIIDRTTIMNGSVQGFDVTMIIYQKAPNKRKQLTKVGGSEQQLIYNGERGIMKMGVKEEKITGAELEKLKYESTIALLPEHEYYGITLNLEGVEIVDSVEAYKVIMTLPSGIKWTQYYDTETHLKVKESKYVKTPAGLFEQEIWYDDYQEIEGIKYPFKIKQKLGIQIMEFNVSSIKVNTGLAEREFEID